MDGLITLSVISAIITIFRSICEIVGIVVIIKCFVKSIYLIIKHFKNKNKKQQYVQKTIKFDIELADKVKELSHKSERSFSNQVKFMIKKYLESTENK